MKTQIAPEILKKISASLPWGANRRIAEALGYSQYYVSMVRTGKYFNQKVFDAFIQTIKEQKNKNRKLAEKAEQVLI